MIFEIYHSKSLRSCEDKIYIYIFFSNKLHYMKEFPETTQKAFEVQLTLGCKAEKEKYCWKSELLQSHSLNSSSKMLASESFLTMDLSGKLRSSHWRGGLVLFCSRFWSKNILELRFNHSILCSSSDFYFSCFKLTFSVFGYLFYCQNVF